MFEKIVFYVSPEYGRLTAAQLKKAAGELMPGFENGNIGKKHRKRKRGIFRLRPAVLLVGTLLLAGAIIFTVVCK